MRIRSLTLVLAVLSILFGACGDDQGTPAPTEGTEAPTTTAAPTTTTTTLPPIGTPFTTDEVLEIAGITDIVGSGTATITLTDDGKLRTGLNGTIPIVDGRTCHLCMDNLILGPGVVLELPLSGQGFVEGDSVFIVVGDDGATFLKVGAGFRLIEGEAWLVTDPSVLDSTGAVDSTTTTTAAAVDSTTTTTAAAVGRIAFTSDRDGDWEIFVMDIDGFDVTQLTNDGAASPAWSPDGTRIAFTSNRDGDSDVFVMDADGLNVTRLTNDGGRSPAWSPDGTRIAFMSNRDFEVFVMDADGSNVTQLTDDAGWDGGPSWSPDGTRIAFESDRRGDSEVFMMDADGSNVTQLTDDPGGDSSPVWSP